MRDWTDGGQEAGGPAAWLLRGTRPLGGPAADIVVTGGIITDITPAGAAAAPAGAQVLDATGLIALPGLVDLHTHLREPGREDAETVETGTAAAALGGFTAVHAMANTDPVADTAGVVEQIWRLGRRAGRCDVRPVGAVTTGLEGRQLAELGAMHDSRARVRIFSDDGRCVSDAVLMRRALEYVKAFGGVIAQHAQEPRLTEGAQVNEGEMSGRLGLAGWPAVAEEAIIARDCLLTAHVGSALHVCHVSTAGSVEIIRWAKSKGWRVTAEVTPHHLLLTDELAAGYDPVYKVNPPLRTAADVEALRAALADGTIDCVATDHAPHPVEDKETEWQVAAFGMTGLETALRVVQEAMVDSGLLDWAGVADRMSARPAAIGQLDGAGTGGAAAGGPAAEVHGRPLEPGGPANIVLYDPAARSSVDPAGHASRSRNSPFAGMILPGQVQATFLRGTATVLDGKLAR
ncbi:MAG TPA: dihydroorotase [Streptosporangiaceae bacterium]|nr:dihydroorotase [Streptosporangiaceae bacterium]